MAAVKVLLWRYTGETDVVVGTPIANRNRAEVEGLIGFFVNTLVLRTGLGGDPSFREVLRQVREVTLGAFEHQELPFEKLVAELQPERSLSRSPLFQVSFALDDADEFALDDAAHRIDILATCRTSYKTGVEMEAMTACSVAALTIYDMCKAADKGIVIEQVRLKYKAGGKSGEWRND